MFYYRLNGRDTQKMKFQNFFHVYFMEKLNEISLKETNIFLYMHEIFNILDP